MILVNSINIETKGMAHIVMCACDDDSSGAISHEEFNSDVCQAIVHFEVSHEDFDNCDTNGDGEVDLDEALAAIEADENEPMSRALRVFNRDNFFSNDGTFKYLLILLKTKRD